MLSVKWEETSTAVLLNASIPRSQLGFLILVDDFDNEVILSTPNSFVNYYLMWFNFSTEYIFVVIKYSIALKKEK